MRPDSPDHARHIWEGEPDEDLVEALEPDQLVEAMEAHVARRTLSPATRLGLGALRILLLLVTAMVVYTFVVQVQRGPGT